MIAASAKLQSESHSLVTFPFRGHVRPMAQAKRVNGSWAASDGSTFTFQRWEPPRPPRCRVLCIHGLGGEASDFDLPARKFAEKCDALAFATNLRGQGLDPVETRRGAFMDPEVLRDDLEHFTNLQGQTDLPLYIIGESMGGMLATRFSAPGILDPEPAGLMLLVPVVALRYETPFFKKLTLNLVAPLAPNHRIKLGDVALDQENPIPLGIDEAGRDYIQRGPQCLRTFSLRFLQRLEQLMLSADKAASRLRLPTLHIHAGQDCFISPEQSHAFFQRIGSGDKTERFFPEAHHLILRDYDTDAVVHALTHWLSRQLEKRVPSSEALEKRAPHELCPS